ncbi:complement decay-accelerating factor isoform X9 [Myotis yumanensis]|uniref:complement decay-accelerating factor isoform X9 n=1 Tax=Myotis yumanensis TaxID=159337 RepID=UPI0038D3963F
MRPARRGALAVLRPPGWLTLSLLPLLLLLLLLCPHAVRGDCGIPPDDVPNASPDLENRTTFPDGYIVGFYCDRGYVKMRGALSGKHCLPNGEWTKLAPFCNRTCSLPPKVLYAAMKDIFIPVSYRPAGFVVEYECNPGYARNHSVSAEVTCLQNYTWSTLQVFCYKRSCPDPGQIENGHISIPTDILFASDIYFSCNPGYKLVGENSTFCYYEENDMVWADPFPVCQEIPTTTQKPTTTDAQSSKPPSSHQKPTTVNVPGTKSPSTPPKPTTVNVPATKSPSTPPKPTTVNVPATKSPSTPPKPTTVNVPATKPPPALKKPTTVNVPETQLTVQTLIMTNSSATRATPKPQSLTTAKASYTQSLPVTKKFTMVHAPMTKGLHTTQRLTSAHIAATQNEAVFTTPRTSKGNGLLTAGITIIGTGLTVGAIIIAIISLTKIFGDYGRSGSYYIQENNKEFNVMSHNLTETGDASEVWPSGKLRKDTHL